MTVLISERKETNPRSTWEMFIVERKIFQMPGPLLKERKTLRPRVQNKYTENVSQ